MKETNGNAQNLRSVSEASSETNGDIIQQATFARMLEVERKRSERSRKRGFVLVLLDCGSIPSKTRRDSVLARVEATLPGTSRETDIKGWYEEDKSLGILFTDLATSEVRADAKTLVGKVRKELSASLTVDELSSIRFSYEIFPGDQRVADECSDKADSPAVQSKQYAGPTGASLLVKRGVDVVGSTCALVLGAPFLAAVAIAIKLTSKGPILFRQTRYGQHGEPFTFLKFRSMHVNNDPKIHQEFVKKLITGQQCGQTSSESSSQVFKLTNDPRITRIGGWLRRTSVDEIPQFINVLKGDMSLVGPRPPLSYELDHYEAWHRRRLDVKPGITGLWQVKGRSRTTFDEMVRMDLDYVQTWSLWLDIKILLLTPLAVLMGRGAY